MLYETFLNKLTNTVYAKKLGAQAKTLTEKKRKNLKNYAWKKSVSFCMKFYIFSSARVLPLI